MLNRIILIGRLVADPQLRYTTGGIPVTNFRIAVDRPYTNQQGERETDFIDIVVWRKMAETVAHNITKGRLVAVDGRLQIRQYEWEGQKRQAAEVYADDVRFLDKREGGSAAGRATSFSGPSTSGANFSGPGFSGPGSSGPASPAPDDFGSSNGPDDVPF